ncbi:MAG TPA: tetratricopeptide repeat protein [Bacteroidia bacterium]|jgi:TolA-binding protein|nr:tetratricopeptide repeat protein [Bacteroidia bacterium]
MKKNSTLKTVYFSALAAGSFALLFAGCGGGNKGTAGNSDTLRQSCLNSIKNNEAKLKTTVTPDAYTYNSAITSYLKFANSFPNDTMTPGCYFDAANISMSLNQYQRAIKLYDTVALKYPSFKRVADCYFIRGFIYDDKLKDTAKARAMYQAVIDKFPHDSLASQARAAISILGKSYDEIIKQFEEKNKAQKKT